MPEQTLHRPTSAEINLANLSFNLRSVRRFIDQDIAYMAVVKANAYGHGVVECAKRFQADGVDWFGVALPEEAVELRAAGITTPILCLGSFWHGQENLILQHDITPVIYRFENAEWLNSAAKRSGRNVNIHVKVDTGMGRIGVPFAEIRAFAEKLKQCANLNVEGVMTHFAAADDLSDNEFTGAQMLKLNESVDTFRSNGFTPKYVDMANSPGAIAHPDSRGNMVRLGGILYGLGGDVLPKGIEKPELRPVLSLITRIAHLKQVGPNTSLGYGRTFVTDRESLIATIPIGYQDGLPRALSNRGRAIVNSVFAPIVGRISMDWTILDVTDVPNVTIDDQAVLIGAQGDLTVKAEDIARETGTISYEITCGIDQRVPRRYIDGS
ncbi:MAG: alanine racemase [Pyrinomonadaceae bacterium]